MSLEGVKQSSTVVSADYTEERFQFFDLGYVSVMRYIISQMRNRIKARSALCRVSKDLKWTSTSVTPIWERSASASLLSLRSKAFAFWNHLQTHRDQNSQTHANSSIVLRMRVEGL